MNNQKQANSKLYASEWNEVADMFMKVMRIPKISTSQRDALTPDNGMLIYNTDNNRFERYENGAWGPFAGSGGITKLSELTIDVSKDWLEYDITNLGDLIPLAAGTSLLGDDTHSWYSLHTIGYLKCHGTGTPTALMCKGDAETYARFILDHNGKLSFGVGSADLDTFLYRSAANELKTDGGLKAKFLNIPDGAGAYVEVPSLTTAERDALTPSNGMIIYNSTLSKFQCYEAGSWVNVIGSGGGFSGNLSDLTIDVDKDWNAKKITNIHDIFPIDSDSLLGDETHKWYTLTVAGYLKGIGAATGSLLLGITATDTFNRIIIDHNGKISWGVGVTDVDTFLYRNAADELKTDGSFKANKFFIGVTEIVSNLRVLENIASFSFTPQPTSDGGYSLGLTDKRWNNGFINYLVSKTISIDDGGSDFLKLPNLTTVQRDTIIAQNGMQIYNSTLGKFQAREAGVWVNMIGGGLLSALTIDADKDWNSKAITNLGNLDALALKIGATEVITSTRVLQNITMNAALVTSGTFAEARIPHTWASAFTLNADFNLNGSLLASTDRLYLGLPTSKVAARIYFTDDTSNGKIEIGSDCNLYRSGADVLKTDDSFSTANLYIGGSCVIPSTKRLQNMADIIFPSIAYGTPASGSSYWDATAKKLYIYDGSAWKYAQLS